MGDLPVGAAVITPGGALRGRFLIHVVLQSEDEPVTLEGLRLALRNGLRRAEEWGLESLALPPLGIGAGNMETDEAASVMVPLISQHLEAAGSLQEVLILVTTGYEEDVFVRSIEWNESHPHDTKG
jgi:O-acetyl-ADP-ribose deacetylase (regulator of RNase III)